MQFISSISGFPISAQSAAYAPTNSAEVSAIASAYAGSGTSVASLPISGSSGSSTAVYGGESTRIVSGFGDYRKETDFSAGLVIIAKDDYDNNTRDRLDITPTGISNMHYNQGSVTNSWQFGSNEYGHLTSLQSNSSNWNNKQDALTFGYDYDSNTISSINGTALAGGGGGGGAASLPISGSSENGDLYWQGEYNVSELSFSFTSNNITKSTHIDPASIYLAETAYGTARTANIDCEATERWNGYSSTKQDTLNFLYNASNEISSINGSALAGVYFDSATCSAIASSYAESAASGKQDTLTFGYDSGAISSINGSSIAGGGSFDSAACSAIASAYASGKQDLLTFGYDAGAISSINGSALAGGSGGGGGGASGDQYVYHAPAHSIIFCFENTSYNPTTDSNVSSIGTWTQLSAGSNIWQLTMSTGSWANKFYDSGTGATKLSQRCEILSIDFTGVTSLQNFMRGAQVTRIREIRSSIECSADGAFQGTSELRGHVEFPALHGTTFASMFRNSGVDSIRINSLYEYMTPGWEGDPEMGEMGADDWYEGATCSSMFCECHRLRNVEIYGAHVGACDSMFKYCDSLAEIPCMEVWDFCGGSFSYMFYGCRSLIWVPNISCYHPAWQGSMDSWTNGGNTDYMFYECISLQRMPYFNGHFGECSSTAYMFFNCSSLISIKWENISELGYYSYMEWDEESQMETEVSTYVVQNVSQMFQNCGNVLHGAVGVYQGMTNYWNQITSNGHGGTFSNCGTDVGSTELASIPRNWGGTQS